MRSADGTVILKGELVSFEGDTYSLTTELGALELSASRVDCQGRSCPVLETRPTDVQISGSDTVALGIMPLLLSDYADQMDAEPKAQVISARGSIQARFARSSDDNNNPGGFLVTATSSSKAFEKLNDGTADIGLASRRIKPAEADMLQGSGSGDMFSPAHEHIIAVDSLVVITHPKNPVQTLSMRQLRDIYSGKITNWSQFGGHDQPITVVARQESSATRDQFETRLFSDAAQTADATYEARDNNAVAAKVNADPNAIGYVGYAFTRGAKPVNLINECGMKTQPDAFSAKTEEYAFQRRLYMYARSASPREDTRDFLEFATSKQADAAISKAGFIDFAIRSKLQTRESSRARALQTSSDDPFEGIVKRDMLNQMVNFERLSTTFRFPTGSAELDERASRDMARLTDYLNDQPYGTRVMFVGFSDDVGPFEPNRALSINRAEKVMNRFAEYAGGTLRSIDLTHTGFGEVAPTACNITEKGRAVNRRVEVWVSRATS